MNNTANKKDVLNKDLWLKLLDAMERHIVHWVKVKGHADNKYNERCDECAKGLKIVQDNYKSVNFLCELDISDLDSIYGLIDDKIVYNRVKHVVSEMDRVKKTYSALNSGDLETVGKLLNASHKSLKEDYEVTGLELDTIVELAQGVDGVLGARMIGAGFAGCAIAIVKKGAVDNVIENVCKEYKKIIGYDCDIYEALTKEVISKYKC